MRCLSSLLRGWLKPQFIEDIESVAGSNEHFVLPRSDEIQSHTNERINDLFCDRRYLYEHELLIVNKVFWSELSFKKYYFNDEHIFFFVFLIFKYKHQIVKGLDQQTSNQIKLRQSHLCSAHSDEIILLALHKKTLWLHSRAFCFCFFFSFNADKSWRFAN